jgi:radical SAM superfamily enzyme YgiQ (UPF0313 family)
MPSDIILSAINGRYHHCALGLRYLYANLGELQSRTKIQEFTLNQNAKDIAEHILSESPKIVGFGVYIWNTHHTYEVVSILKKVSPQTLIVLGGPEVSHETKQQPLCQLADFTLRGEADLLFANFCSDFLLNDITPTHRWISAEPPDILKLTSPYAFYTDEDIRHRVLYVEASRGCPYKCEYCLSSLDKSVRNFDLDRFLIDMEDLIQRGARRFKFIDRTFNLSQATSTRILKFFLERASLGLFIHFEMVPDRLPNELRELIQRFPPGSLQFEIGIQTWNPEVAQRVNRRQDYQRIQDNFAFLTRETGVHIHADLIAGLPGETLESFAQGFDAVSALNPHEIQVGLLKRLKGTPIIRHDQEWGMLYHERSPFYVLKTKTLSFETLQKLHRFSRFWNLYANSGNFKATMQLLKSQAREQNAGSVFWAFFDFCEFLSLRYSEHHGIALLSLVESAWIYLTEHLSLDLDLVRTALIQDYAVNVKREIPVYLRTVSVTGPGEVAPTNRPSNIPTRQARHLL